MRLLRSCRASIVVEMKRAHEERELVQLKVSEVTGLKTHLMMAKVDEIINEVVAPERARALKETDEVTRSTLCEATLPSQVVEPQYGLTEEEQEAVEKLAGGLKREQLDESCTEMTRKEQEFAEAVIQRAGEASAFAMERQLAAVGRNMLHQKRMQVGVSQAVGKMEHCRSPGERAKTVAIPEPVQPPSPSGEGGASPKGRGPLSQPLSWNANADDGTSLMQPVLKDVVIGKVAVDIGRAGGPIPIQVYGNDDPAEVAADFCATYGKFSAQAKNKLMEAVLKSKELTEQFSEERDDETEPWVVVSEVQEVGVDMRRDY